MSKMIVSANYLDRQSVERWLFRDASLPADAATPVTTLHATGVAFCPSSGYESGFGCYTVAHCNTAVPLSERPTLPENAVRLGFNVFDLFHVKSTGKRVETCEQMFLMPDGAMYAVLNEEPAFVLPSTASETVKSPRQEARF